MDGARTLPSRRVGGAGRRAAAVSCSCGRTRSLKGVMVREPEEMLSIVVAESAGDVAILQVCGELTGPARPG